MDRTSNSTYRPALATASSNPATPATPPLSNTGTVAMSIADLKRCSIPPLHDNPHVDLATASDKTRDWLYNGTRPQSAAEVKAIAAFCVKQKLPDALSWLVLQCGLNNLDLAHAELDVQDVQMIASWLDRSPGPIKLNLSGNGLGDNAARLLSRAFKSSTTLTGLNVSNNKIGVSGLTELAEALKTNAALTSLDVSANNIDDTGVIVLADALRTNSALTSLNVSHNKIGDTGATAFANALKTNETLTSFEAGGNNIGNTGVYAFVYTLETNTTLTWLRVGNISGRDHPFVNRLIVNAEAKPLAAPAAEAFFTLPPGDSKLPLEVGALIVKEMITLPLGRFNDAGLDGLESLVYESAIAKQRERDKKG